jgi:hypothetical protein
MSPTSSTVPREVQQSSSIPPDTVQKEEAAISSILGTIALNNQHLASYTPALLTQAIAGRCITGIPIEMGEGNIFCATDNAAVIQQDLSAAYDRTTDALLTAARQAASTASQRLGGLFGAAAGPLAGSDTAAKGSTPGALGGLSATLNAKAKGIDTFLSSVASGLSAPPPSPKKPSSSKAAKPDSQSSAPPPRNVYGTKSPAPTKSSPVAATDLSKIVSDLDKLKQSLKDVVGAGALQSTGGSSSAKNSAPKSPSPTIKSPTSAQKAPPTQTTKASPTPGPKATPTPGTKAASAPAARSSPKPPSKSPSPKSNYAAVLTSDPATRLGAQNGMDLLAQSMAEAARGIAEAKMSMLNGVNARLTTGMGSGSDLAKSILDSATKVGVSKPVSPSATTKKRPV